MQIQRRKEEKFTRFNDVVSGDLFITDTGNVYIKTDKSNAVCFENGHITTFNKHKEVLVDKDARLILTK